jgi:hypothetical protein
MATGYTFKSVLLKKSRQLSRNLPKDACHSCSIRELKNEKTNTDPYIKLIIQ